MTAGLARWSRYQGATSFVLGFHGCDSKIGEAVLASSNPKLLASTNDYDWLGNGVYFWEGSPQRALEFATQRAAGGKNSKGKIAKPFVLGAVIDLARCLNLIDIAATQEVAAAFARLKAQMDAIDQPLPVNTGGADKFLRRLDRLVIESTHKNRETEGFLPYQTVRGIFAEGGPAYEGAGFDAKTHVQICVRDLSVIRGFFRPIDESAPRSPRTTRRRSPAA